MISKEELEALKSSIVDSLEMCGKLNHYEDDDYISLRLAKKIVSLRLAKKLVEKDIDLLIKKDVTVCTDETIAVLLKSLQPEEDEEDNDVEEEEEEHTDGTIASSKVFKEDNDEKKAKDVFHACCEAFGLDPRDHDDVKDGDDVEELNYDNGKELLEGLMQRGHITKKDIRHVLTDDDKGSNQ